MASIALSGPVFRYSTIFSVGSRPAASCRRWLHVFLWAVGCASLTPVLSAQQESPLEVSLAVLKPGAEGDGKDALVNAAEAAPGSVLVYRVTYRNRAAGALKDIVASLPVPEGVAYEEASAKPAAVQASVDGKTFFDVAQPPKDTPAAAWRVLRWEPRPLAAGAEFTVEIHARVLKTGE